MSQAGSIESKRRRMSPAALRRKSAAGEYRGDERGFVRVGTTTSKILAGEDDLSEWDDEELRRGRRRCQVKGRYFGKFQGKDPIVVPKLLHDELVKRTIDKAAKLFQESLYEAVEILVELMRDPSTEPKDKIKAVQMITERVMGKPKDTIEFSGDKPWHIALTGGIVHSVAEDEDDEDD